MTKHRSKIFLTLFLILFAVAAGIFMFGDTKSASAASYGSGRYRLDVDLIYQVSPNTTRDFEVYLSGSTSLTGVSGTIKGGDTLKFSPKKLEIVIPYGSANQWHTQHARIFNVKLSGPTTFSAPNYIEGSTSENVTASFTLTDLADGSYTLSFEVQFYYRANSNGSWNDPKTTTFNFKVDTSAPTISGASTSRTGKYTNKAFTVRATDSGSGVDAMYMKSPASSSYTKIGTSKTISAGSVNGLYTFYATDKAGYRSSNYYVYYDNVAPNGKLTSSSGQTLTSGASTKDGFSFSATDSGSGIESITYKTPSISSYIPYTAGTEIPKTAEQGEYVFRAEDKSGNISTYSVTLYDPCAQGHNYTQNVVPPTCTQGGYTIFTCSGCGESYTGNPTSPTGHDYKATTTSATCTQSGVTTYKCSNCGDSYTDDSVAPTGHSYVEEVVEPTCTKGGYSVFRCVKCGESYKGNQTQPYGHSLVSEEIAATCENGGGIVYKCTRCNYSYGGNATPALGHSYVTQTIAPTCEKGGYTLHACSRCGDSYKDNESQPLGHNFISVTEEATCTEYGKTVYTCQVCGYEEEMPDGIYPTGHNYSNFIVKAATCTQDGERRFVCDKCGDEYTEVIPATGHSYAITDSSSESGVTTRVYTCMLCGDSYTQELGDQYEEVSSYIEELFEQYRPYMWWVLLATAGIWSIVMGVFFAIAQKNEDKEKAKKMIVNYFVGLVVIFAILVACPYLIRGIAALVT